MKYLKKLNQLCFSPAEMKGFLEGEFKRILFEELAKQQTDLSSFEKNKKAMEDFTFNLVRKNNKRTEFVELFSATNLAELVYESNNTLVCFELKKTIQPNLITKLNTYQELVNILEKNTIVDFAIFNNDGLRQFQLKQYKNLLETEQVAKFIKKKLEGYGDLGQINLLVLLQGPDNDDSQIVPINIDFELIHNILKNGKFKTNAEVLIAMNDRNEEEVITQVYPSLNQFRKKISIPSKRW